MLDSSRIPPVQLPITTIATNIMQTPQTPLDQKVALTKPVKPIVTPVKKRKKDQVTITEQHWTMLKERREIEKLRDLQIVLLFSQLMKEGLSQLQWSVDQMIQRLMKEEIKKAEIRQALHLFYKEILNRLHKKLLPVEKQLGFLIEKGPHLIEIHQGEWQIKNADHPFPVQMMLSKIETEIGTVVFPNTLQQEVLLKEKRREVEDKSRCVQELEHQVKDAQQNVENQREKVKKAEKQRDEKQAIFDYWQELAENKQLEQVGIQKKIEQMELVHPLKRKQQEYQAYVLRNQIVQKELITITMEMKKATLNKRVFETKVIQLQEALLAEQEKMAYLQKEIIQSQEVYQVTVEKEAELLNAFQAEFSQAYQELKEEFDHYLIKIYEEQAKTILLEKHYREQLAGVLKELKQILEKENKQSNAKAVCYLKEDLMSRQAETLLSQANADPMNVKHLLDENS